MTKCSGAETARSWYRVRATSFGFLVAKDDFLLGVTSVSSTPGPRECVLICEKTSFCSKFLRYSWLFFFPAWWIIKCLHSPFRLTEFKSFTDHKPFKYVKFTFNARKKKKTYGKETNYIHIITLLLQPVEPQ